MSQTASLETLLTDALKQEVKYSGRWPAPHCFLCVRRRHQLSSRHHFLNWILRFLYIFYILLSCVVYSSFILKISTGCCELIVSALTETLLYFRSDSNSWVRQAALFSPTLYPAPERLIIPLSYRLLMLFYRCHTGSDQDPPGPGVLSRSIGAAGGFDKIQ